MRGLFSWVSLLVVLAIVGFMAKHQLGASGRHQAASASSPSSAPQVDTPQQGQQLQKQVQDDVNRLMQGRASDLEQASEPKP
ncbi:MAG: hypothetical protein EOP36_10920 [Rubrivivax sp.]|nr:MAG: hypothetical protein EOP36_10920 [Rubrivivax sp.]